MPDLDLIKQGKPAGGGGRNSLDRLASNQLEQISINPGIILVRGRRNRPSA
jgi:hypothetical protein